MTHRQTFKQIANYFENISPESVQKIKELYAPTARFKDPFNDVKGIAEIERIFQHMFVSLAKPRFVVIEEIVDGSQAFLTWEFRFKFRRFDTEAEQVVLGTTHLVLDAQGLVCLHRDYWDAAEELYEKLPVVGSVMRWLKRRANS